MTSRFGRIAALQAAVFVTASTYIAYAISILVSAVVARSLGPADYGQYAYFVFIVGLLVMLANNGLTTSAIRFVSECLGRERADLAARVHGKTRRWQLLSVAIVLALFALWSIFTPPTGIRMPLAYYLAAVLICVLTKTLYVFGVSIAKGYGNFRIEPYTTLIFAVLSGIASLLLAWRGAAVPSYVALFAATSIGIFACGSVLLRRSGIRPEAGALEAPLDAELRAHLLWTLLLAFSGALGTRSIETWLLAQRFGPEPVAYYTIAGNLMRGSAEMLTVGLSAVLMPAMSRAFGGGGVERVRPIFSDSIRYLTFLGLLLAGYGALWADPIVRLMYGERFLATIPVLQIMLITAGATLSEASTGALLTTTGRQRSRAGIFVLNLAVSATLAFLLVPRFGLLGATLSFVGARLAFCALIGIYALRATRTPLPTGPLLRLLAAALIAGTAAFGLTVLQPGIAGWLFAGVLYALLFLLLSVLLRAWTPHDVDLALQVAERAPRLLSWLRPALELWRRRFTR
jgi:O-antigen/teichoic acid export membrane protein